MYQPDVNSLGDLRAVAGWVCNGRRWSCFKKVGVLSEATQVEKANASCSLVCRSWLLIRMDAYMAVTIGHEARKQSMREGKSRFEKGAGRL